MHHSILPCDFALPAEWEPQSAIMLTWTHGGTDWKPYLRQITNTYLQLADIITRYEDLLVVTPILESTQRMLAEKLSEGQMNRVHLYEMDTTVLSAWYREAGATRMSSLSICSTSSSTDGARNSTGKRTMPSICSSTIREPSMRRWRTTRASCSKAEA